MENQYSNAQNSMPRTITQDTTLGYQQQHQQNHLSQNQHQQNHQPNGGQEEQHKPPVTELSQLLKHCKDLEMQKTKLQQQLEDQINMNKKISEKTRTNMQHVLDTIMKKWVDAVDTKDEQVKTNFIEGMQRLVQNSAEDNGVWQMMVQASSLYERQTHELDQLRIENSQLKDRVQGTFGSEDARMSGDKRKAEDELERPPAISGDIWSDFAKGISGSGY